jgi:hypothetical protein
MKKIEFKTDKHRELRNKFKVPIWTYSEEIQYLRKNFGYLKLRYLKFGEFSTKCNDSWWTKI